MGISISSNEKDSVDLQFPSTNGERQLADPQVADALAGLLNESNPWLRQAVVGALEGLGDAAVEALIVALSDSDAGVRRRVVEALGRLEDERIEEPLTFALNDDNSGVRKSAADALHGLRWERPAEPTISTDHDEKPDLQQTAHDTERPVRDTKIAIRPTPANDDKNVIKVHSASIKAQPIGAAKAVELAIAPSNGIRDDSQTASDTEGPINDTKTVVPLITIRHLDPQMRAAAAERFGHLGDPRAVAPLIGLLGDSDSLVRQAATKALGRLGDPAVEPLITAFRDGNVVVQRQAIHLLANQKNVRQEEPFITALEKDDEIMRADAIRALQRIGTPAALAAIQQHEARTQRLAKIKGVVRRLISPAVARMLRQPSS